MKREGGGGGKGGDCVKAERSQGNETEGRCGLSVTYARALRLSCSVLPMRLPCAGHAMKRSLLGLYLFTNFFFGCDVWILDLLIHGFQYSSSLRFWLPWGEFMVLIPCCLWIV